MSERKAQKFPSTSHYVGHKWVHDPLNCPLAEHEAQGNLEVRDLGQLAHITSIQGYCAHGVLGGCPKDDNPR